MTNPSPAASARTDGNSARNATVSSSAPTMLPSSALRHPTKESRSPSNQDLQVKSFAGSLNPSSKSVTYLPRKRRSSCVAPRSTGKTTPRPAAQRNAFLTNGSRLDISASAASVGFDRTDATAVSAACFARSTHAARPSETRLSASAASFLAACADIAARSPAIIPATTHANTSEDAKSVATATGMCQRRFISTAGS